MEYIKVFFIVFDLLIIGFPLFFGLKIIWLNFHHSRSRSKTVVSKELELLGLRIKKNRESMGLNPDSFVKAIFEYSRNKGCIMDCFNLYDLGFDRDWNDDGELCFSKKDLMNNKKTLEEIESGKNEILLIEKKKHAFIKMVAGVLKAPVSI